MILGGLISALWQINEMHPRILSIITTCLWLRYIYRLFVSICENLLLYGTYCKKYGFSPIRLKLGYTNSSEENFCNSHFNKMAYHI